MKHWPKFEPERSLGDQEHLVAQWPSVARETGTDAAPAVLVEPEAH